MIQSQLNELITVVSGLSACLRAEEEAWL